MTLSRIYTPTLLLDVVKNVPAPSTFLRDLLVSGPDRVTAKKYINVDEVTGGSAVARYVSREGGPSVIGKKGFSSRIHLAPYIYESITFTPADVDVIEPGDDPYADGSMSVTNKITESLADLKSRIIRAEELQIANALLTGKNEISGVDVDYTIDYGMPTANIIDVSSSGPWTTTSTDILGQLSSWSLQIAKSGAPMPNKLIGDVNSISALLNNTRIKDILDNRQMNIGNVDIKLINKQNAAYIATLTWPGFSLDIYTYSATYTDFSSGSASEKSYIPSNHVILTSENISSQFVYGKIENFKTGDFIGKQFPMVIDAADGKTKTVSIESAPFYALKQPKGVISAKVA
jgi:hypothetical protein